MEELTTIQEIAILAIVMLWVLPWKGYALWNAARLNHKWWFIVLLVTNTLAILDIIYVLFVVRKHNSIETPEEPKTTNSYTPPGGQNIPTYPLR